MALEATEEVADDREANIVKLIQNLAKLDQNLAKRDQDIAKARLEHPRDPNLNAQHPWHGFSRPGSPGPKASSPGPSSLPHPQTSSRPGAELRASATSAPPPRRYYHLAPGAAAGRRSVLGAPLGGLEHVVFAADLRLRARFRGA
ncbi:Hypothetical Protein FCC1311_095942 [Hondaea fermentalgiana]|uniref:Uncharacterized protein n=1 Tax=Hondaea fermentalgiana TaxID=2315210 RepID=A0A2R5GY51_9STRA|nr:Hypothetical Protein FCC1311_095942 [Hondaea fermentalgiana]|eukprot:GBG33371.1 Hypothetical Protein FCC1311_095942 [Hondaea fermentalgiana]